MSATKSRGFGASRVKKQESSNSNVATRFGLDEDEIVAEATANGQVLKMKKGLISADPAQPRKIFNKDKHEELKASIEQNGLLQPIIVRNKPNPKEGALIIAGERRWRAIMELEALDTIDVIVRDDIAPENILMAQLIENLQREDMSPLETANAFDQVIKGQGISQKELGTRLGMSESVVSTYMSMLKAPVSIQEAANGGEIKDVTLLAKLSRLSKTDPEKVEELITKVANGAIASAEARAVVNDALKKAKAGDAAVPEKPNSVAPLMVTRLVVTKFSWLSGSDEPVIQVETKHGLYEIAFEGDIEGVLEALQAGAEGRAG